jgi:hypothetical protein
MGCGFYPASNNRLGHVFCVCGYGFIRFLSSNAAQRFHLPTPTLESHVSSTTSTVENPGRARLLEPVQNMFAYRDGRLDPNLLSQPLCQATALVKSVRGDVCHSIQYCLCCLLHAWCFCTFIIRFPVYSSGLERATYSSATRFSDVLRPGLKLTCRLFAL